MARRVHNQQWHGMIIHNQLHQGLPKVLVENSRGGVSQLSIILSQRSSHDRNGSIYAFLICVVKFLNLPFFYI